MHALALVLAQNALQLTDEREIAHRRAALARRAAEDSRQNGLREIVTTISTLFGRPVHVPEQSITPALSGYPYQP